MHLSNFHSFTDEVFCMCSNVTMTRRCRTNMFQSTHGIPLDEICIVICLSLKISGALTVSPDQITNGAEVI